MLFFGFGSGADGGGPAPVMGSVVARDGGDVDKLRRKLVAEADVAVRKLARVQLHPGNTAGRPEVISLHTRSRLMMLS